MTKRIVLCADDYGQAPAISQGIVSLIKYGRLSATSCLVNTPYWPEHAKWLIPLKFYASVGLHFNLTEGKALSPEFAAKHGENFPTLMTLLWWVYTGRLDKKAVAAEFEAQIDQFVEGYGEWPAFIDGHQHIHQFPIIRDAFVEVYERKLQAESPYVRWVNEKVNPLDLLTNFKKLVILSLGTQAFKALLDKHHIPHNQTFGGIYPFGCSAEKYRKWFLKFLRACQDGGVMMCHPGLPEPSSADPIANARSLEYQYLFSPQFLQDCYSFGVSLMSPSRNEE